MRNRLLPFWWLLPVAALLLLIAAPAPPDPDAATAGPGRAARRPDPAALARYTGAAPSASPRVTPTPPGGEREDDAVIPLLREWRGDRVHRALDTGRNLFASEPDLFHDAEVRRAAAESARADAWRAAGASLATGVLREGTSFACLLRYGGDCPAPPPPPPTPPRFPYELIGVISIHHVKYASFHDPAGGTLQAKADEKIGDSPFRVVRFNLTSVEVRAEGFTQTEKLPLSTGAANGTP